MLDLGRSGQMNPCCYRDADKYLIYRNFIKNTVIPVLGSLRKKMNGRSALQIGIQDLFSNNRAAGKVIEESHCIFYSFEESHN